MMKPKLHYIIFVEWHEFIPNAQYAIKLEVTVPTELDAYTPKTYFSVKIILC